MLLFHYKATLGGSVTVLNELVRYVFDGCSGSANSDRYILASLTFIIRLRWVILVRRGDRPVIKI